jgi:hypothetical protein
MRANPVFRGAGARIYRLERLLTLKGNRVKIPVLARVSRNGATLQHLQYLLEMLESIAHYAPGIGAVIAALGFVFGVISYAKQNALRRFEAFHRLREVGRADKAIDEVINCLRNEKREQAKYDKLRNMEPWKKYRFLSFQEEIALMHESGLIRTSVAHYMFGFFCVRCLESDEFWHGIEGAKTTYYWSLFLRFANLMQQVERQQLGEYGKLSDEEKLRLCLATRPSWAFWRRQAKFRF